MFKKSFADTLKENLNTNSFKPISKISKIESSVLSNTTQNIKPNTTPNTTSNNQI